MAELALLVSIYVAIVTAAVYLAQIGLVKTGARRMAGYAAAQAGQQALGDVQHMMPAVRSAFVGPFSDAIDSAEMWTGDDIDATLEEIARAPVGHYVYRNGEIIYELDEDRLSAYGRYIFDNDLQAESDAVAGVLAGWMYRTTATASARYDPIFGEWDTVDIEGITSHSYVSGGLDRGSHPQDDPTFNRDIFELLSSSGDFPPPITPEPELWLSGAPE